MTENVVFTRVINVEARKSALPIEYYRHPLYPLLSGLLSTHREPRWLVTTSGRKYEH